jgi:hypothetical protein
MVMIKKILELVKEVTPLVKKEIVINLKKCDYVDIPDDCYDSFGDIFLRGRCEPEDAIWQRDLQDNYHEGLEVGIRNTLKVLKDNPQLLEKLNK